MGQFVSKGYLDVDGVPLVKIATLSVSLESGNADVMLLIEGFDGHTVGSHKFVIKISGPIPGDGFEVDWYDLVLEGGTHQVRFVFLRPPESGGGVLKEINLEGDFRDPDGSLGVNKAADLSVTFHGRKA